MENLEIRWAFWDALFHICYGREVWEANSLLKSQHLIKIPRKRDFAPMANVRVDVRRGGDVRVAEPFLDVVDVPPFVDQNARCRMP